MAPLTCRTSATIFRLCPRHQHRLHKSLPIPLIHTTAATSTTTTNQHQQRRSKADIVDRTSGAYDKTPNFDGPFRGASDSPTTKIPDFKKYMSPRKEVSNKVFGYFMCGSMGLLAAAGAQASVQSEFRLYFFRWGRLLGLLWCEGHGRKVEGADKSFNCI